MTAAAMPRCGAEDCDLQGSDPTIRAHLASFNVLNEPNSQRPHCHSHINLPFASVTSEIAVEIGPSCGWSPGQSGAVSQDGDQVNRWANPSFMASQQRT